MNWVEVHKGKNGSSNFGGGNLESMMNKAFQQVNELINAYAIALENFDVKGMALQYELPCSFLSDDSNLVFSEAPKLEAFFNQGISFYKQFGMNFAVPEVRTKYLWSEKIIKTKVRWQYLNQHKKLLYGCDYEYLLRKDKHGHWKISVSVSLNEKQQMEAWKELQKASNEG